MSWKDAYDAVVADLVNQGATTTDELAARLDLMRDELETITSRLIERGVIDKLDA